MIVEIELREHIAAALRDQITLHDLYRWLMERSWNMHKDSEPAAVELAADVESLFFGIGCGEGLDGALRDELSKLVAATDG